MESDIKVRKMSKQQLLELFQATADKVLAINSLHEEIESLKKLLQESQAEIEGDEGLLPKAKEAGAEIEEKLSSVREAFDEICEDTEDENSIKTQLEELVTVFEKKQEEIDGFRKKLFGEQIANSKTGVKEKVPGFSEELDTFYKKQKEKYDQLYSQIEQELLSGATTANLSKAFADKVTEYHKESLYWSIGFIALLFVVLTYYGFATFSAEEAKTLSDVFRHLAFRAPFIAFVIWLGVFIGNRRAESKKLEESYKHKEVMARSFSGYKKTLEDIDDDDGELLKAHMENLLIALKDNSSDFLSTSGENHPMAEILTMPLFSTKKAEETKK